MKTTKPEEIQALKSGKEVSMDQKTAEQQAPRTAEQFQAELDGLKKLVLALQSQKGRGRQPAVPIVDTKTGKIYPSQAEAGKAVAAEFGLTVHNYVWYTVKTLAPDRFKRLDQVTIAVTPKT